MKTIIIPTVSIGNIPQLAITNITNSLEIESTEILDSIYLYPFAGKNDENRIISPIELIKIKKNNGEQLDLSLLQIHSTILPGMKLKYYNQLIRILKENSFEKIIIISSKDRGYFNSKRDSGNLSEVEYWFQNQDMDKNLEKLSLDDGKKDNRLGNLIASVDDTCDLVKYLVKNDVRGIEFLSMWSYEGDNRLDGLKMAKLVGDSIGVEIKDDIMIKDESIDVEGLYN